MLKQSPPPPIDVARCTESTLFPNDNVNSFFLFDVNESTSATKLELELSLITVFLSFSFRFLFLFLSHFPTLLFKVIMQPFFPLFLSLSLSLVLSTAIALFAI